MAKWSPLPPHEKIFKQKDQQAFFNAIAARYCTPCQKIYQKTDALKECPTCGTKGTRVYDRLTVMAGRRFGKSFAGSIAGVREAMIPNTLGWACAPTNDKLHRYVIRAFRQLIPAEWVEEFSVEHNDLILKNGSQIHFQTLEHPDQGRGQGLDWLWIDEVCELTKMHWDVIRPSLAGDTVAFFTTTPRGYDWVYKELFHPAEEGVPGYWRCNPKTIESANPDISAEFLARERQQMSDTMYRQEYEADFVVFEGAVYGDLLLPTILRRDEDVRKLIPEWDPKKPNCGIEDWRAVTIGIDTGADHPFGAVKLVSTEKGLVAVDEYMARDRAFAQHKNDLFRMAGPNPVRWSLNKNERQAILEFSQHGIHCQRAENDQLGGIERVKSWLVNHQLWFVESKVPQTLRQLSALHWAPPPKDGTHRDRPQVFKLDDELPDALRYAVMAWPQLPTPEERSKERDISHFPEDVQDTIRFIRRVEAKEREGAEVATNFNDFWI